MMGKMDILRAVNLTSALATSIEAWMSADVPTWPETLMTSHNRERAETPFHSPKVLAQALRVYTGGGPGLQSCLCAQGIKYLQQFRYPAFGKYSSERHLEKEDRQ